MGLTSIQYSEQNDFSVPQNSETNRIASSSSPSSSLKRKRPLSIKIPHVLQEIQVQTIENRNRRNESEERTCFSGAGYAVFSRKGKKLVMEDTYKAISTFGGDRKKGFFGVYDGHGGRSAAEFVAENLHKNISEMLKNNEEMKKKEAIKNGYLKTDKDFLKKGLTSGACCVTALIEKGEIYVSNLGDCRAVLCRNGVAEALTVDHTAGQQEERIRIEKQGGFVHVHHGIWRIQGNLAVSRSIGDANLKDLVSAHPDTYTLCLTSDMEYLILASDGLWAKVGNQEAINIVRRQYLNMSNDGRKPKSTREEEETVYRSELSRPPVKMNNDGRKPKSTREEETVYRSELSRPPVKMRQILQGNKKIRMCHSNQENDQKDHENVPVAASSPLMETCKDLATFAKLKGNVDDITLQGNKRIRMWHSSRENDQEDHENVPDQENDIENKNITVIAMKKEKREKDNENVPAAAAASSPLMEACKELATIAKLKGNVDDITVMIIDLTYFGQMY